MSQSVQTSFYPEPVMKYLRVLPNSGALNVDNKSVFMSQVGDIEVGLKIKLYIEIKNAIIERAKYLVYSDGYVIAFLGALTDALQGMKVTQLRNYSLVNLADELSIPEGKIKNIKLIKEALENIVSQYLKTTDAK